MRLRTASSRAEASNESRSPGRTRGSPLHAEELLKLGQVDEAMAALQASIRSAPADARLRVFIFQLLSIQGQWERALTQLNVAAEIDPANLLMAEVCRPAIQCEVFRAQVFDGKRAPLVLGEPEEWVGWMVEACRLTAEGRHAPAADLRSRALEAAPATAGRIDDVEFDWIADADARMGPILEAIIDGRYYWVPFSRIAAATFEEPRDLRDAVWAPAMLTLSNGGRKVALIPARYPNSESDADPAVRLGRKTDWREVAEGTSLGLGQRLLATDLGDHPLL
jgi:type VI secretion system protein ImpE